MSVELKRTMPEYSREYLVNPYPGGYRERLHSSGAVDLSGNYRLEQLSGGYDRVVPQDRTRRVLSE